MKRFLWHALLLAALAGIGALVFVGGGFVPIAADQGHWPITRAALEFAMQRSVSTQSLAVKTPLHDDQFLDAPAQVRKGAGHYASGCMPCHGAPGVERQLVPRKMLPAPPPLVRKLAMEGDGLRRIPACSQCHGPGAKEHNRLYPTLAGQPASYLALQLQLFARGGRGGTPYAHLMERAAAKLEPGDIRDLAAYYANLPQGQEDAIIAR